MVLSEEKLIYQRKRDFVLLIIFEITTYVVANVMNNEDYRFSFPPKSWIFGIMISILIPYYFLLYKVTSNYMTSRVYRFGYGAVLITTFVLTGIASQRGVLIAQVITPALLAYFLQILSVSVILVIIVVDMFAHKHDLTYGILAASCVYFLIPVIFAYIFCILGLGDPNLLHADPADVGSLVLRSFEAAHFFAAGIDIPEPGVSSLIKTVAVIESFIMNLYIVFVVGRLFVDSTAKS